MALGADSSMKVIISKFLEISFCLRICVSNFYDLDLTIESYIHNVAFASGCVSECANHQRFLAHQQEIFLLVWCNAAKQFFIV